MSKYETSSAGGTGLLLIEISGTEKGLAGYPQLYSSIDFVHEVRPLAKEVRELLDRVGCHEASAFLRNRWMQKQ